MKSNDFKSAILPTYSEYQEELDLVSADGDDFLAEACDYPASLRMFHQIFLEIAAANYDIDTSLLVSAENIIENSNNRFFSLHFDMMDDGFCTPEALHSEKLLLKAMLADLNSFNLSSHIRIEPDKGVIAFNRKLPLLGLINDYIRDQDHALVTVEQLENLADDHLKEDGHLISAHFRRQAHGKNLSLDPEYANLLLEKMNAVPYAGQQDFNAALSKISYAQIGVPLDLLKKIICEEDGINPKEKRETFTFHDLKEEFGEETGEDLKDKFGEKTQPPDSQFRPPVIPVDRPPNHTDIAALSDLARGMSYLFAYNYDFPSVHIEYKSSDKAGEGTLFIGSLENADSPERMRMGVIIKDFLHYLVSAGEKQDRHAAGINEKDAKDYTPEKTLLCAGIRADGKYFITGEIEVLEAALRQMESRSAVKNPEFNALLDSAKTILDKRYSAPPRLKFH